MLKSTFHRRLPAVVLMALLTVFTGGTAYAAPHPDATGKLLRNGTGLYPRVVRLAHSGSANGAARRLGRRLRRRGRRRGDLPQHRRRRHLHRDRRHPRPGRPRAGCAASTLFELPQQIGAMPAGTLLWAASVGQDAANRRMAIDVWESPDHGVTWSQLPPCQTAPNTGGLWEPEFYVDAEGDLVCHYSDETNPGAHSQSLEERFSSDGRTWGQVFPTVAPANAGLRPGMAIVTQRIDGSYYMTYEVCGTGDKYDCAAHYRTSADGADWGPPADIGPVITTETGQYFTHAPTVAWLNNGTAAGRLVLVGQQFREADGADLHHQRPDRAGQHRERRRQLVPDRRTRRGAARRPTTRAPTTVPRCCPRPTARGCWRSPPTTTGRCASPTTPPARPRAPGTRPVPA